jgi:hypothetical protein
VKAVTDFRFSYNIFGIHSRDDFVETCRRGERFAWEPLGARAKRLRATIEQLHREFARDGYEQQAALRDDFGIPVLRPVQRLGFGGYGPPLIVGGTGDRILRLARSKPTSSASPGPSRPRDSRPGTMRISIAAEADERVRYTRECAGERADHIEWHALTQVVVETDDRRATVGKLAKRFGHLMSPERSPRSSSVFARSATDCWHCRQQHRAQPDLRTGHEQHGPGSSIVVSTSM